MTTFMTYKEECESLRRELENERARVIHSCGPDCTRSGCVNRLLREQLAEKDAEIERLNSKLQSQALDCIAADGQAFDSWQQLAASQAREQQLWNVLGNLAALVRGECPSLLNEDSGGNSELSMEIDDLLRLSACSDERPCINCFSDQGECLDRQTYLQAMITKAGEVMRERAVKAGYPREVGEVVQHIGAIRALPYVTLEDLK